MTKEKKELDKYIEHLSPKVRENIEIVEKDPDFPYMLRIDNVVPKFFTPLMPLSSSEDPSLEDRTVPRICVAHDIVSCILGIARLNKEFLKNNLENDINKKGNIYNISALPYEYAIRPKEKLLHDVELTNEHWLIGYSDDVQKVYPINVGTLFIVSLNVTYKEHNNGKPLTYMNCFINITKDIGVMIKPNRSVEKGYYKLIIEKDNNGKLTVGKLDKTDFNEMKRLVVSKEHFANFTKTKNSLIDKW